MSASERNSTLPATTTPRSWAIMNKSIETLQVATQEYPLQIAQLHQSRCLLPANGEIEKSDAANRRALALQPDNAIALENGVAGATQLNHTPKREVYCGSPASRPKRDFPASGLKLGYYAAQADWNSVQKILAETAGRPDQFVIIAWWGSFLPQLGQFQLAQDYPSPRGGAGGERQGEGRPGRARCSTPPTQAGWSIDASIRSKPSNSALQLDKGKVTLIAAAMTLALCNQEKHANQMLSDLEKHYPEDTLVQELYVPQARAWLALKAGDAQRLWLCWSGFEPTMRFLLRPTCGVLLTCSSKTRAMRSPHSRMRPV